VFDTFNFFNILAAESVSVEDDQFGTFQEVLFSRAILTVEFVAGVYVLVGVFLVSPQQVF
jgi:hypothetical protein